MIDERQEELAALHALDLIEGAEKAAFQSELAQNPELREYVRELRAAAASLAHAAPSAEPPPGLKARILASAEALPASGPSASAPTASIHRFRLIPILIPWAAAACLALAVAQTARLYMDARSENLALAEQQKLADLELRSTRNQLEAERILAHRELLDTRQALNQSIRRIEALNRDLIAQGDLARFKISTLASMLGNSPQALAVAVWDPLGQEGVLEVSKLPAVASGKDYQLWVIDPEYAAPVSAGVFTVDPATGRGRSTFRVAKHVGLPAKFAVSVERQGGAPEPQGPIVMISE